MSIISTDWLLLIYTWSRDHASKTLQDFVSISINMILFLLPSTWICFYFHQHNFVSIFTLSARQILWMHNASHNSLTMISYRQFYILNITSYLHFITVLWLMNISLNFKLVARALHYMFGVYHVCFNPTSTCDLRHALNTLQSNLKTTQLSFSFHSIIIYYMHLWMMLIGEFFDEAVHVKDC